MMKNTPQMPDVSPALVDLDAYFHRTGYDGPREVSVEALHGIVSAHVHAIPFENIDVLLDRGIALDAASIQQKLVSERRGGYCFEQNGLLQIVLDAIGFDVTGISARVRIGYPREIVPPRTHLVNRVKIEGQFWLADVGVGGLSPTAALRFEVDTEQPTPHETRRIIFDGNVYFHQVLLNGVWEDLYEMTLEEMPLVDRKVANWYTSTNPDSRFRNLLMVAKAAPHGVRKTILNDEFSLRDASGLATKQPIRSKEELLALLAEHFDVRLEADVDLQVPGMAWVGDA